MMHQLRSGLCVSGPLPEPPALSRERRRLSAGSSSPSFSIAPYTGGDNPLSGDLARMFPFSPSASSHSHPSPHLRPPPPPPAASSPSLPQSGLLVGPPRPSPPAEPEPITKNPPPTAPRKSEFAWGIPIWCCFLVAAVVAAGIGVGAFVLVSERRVEALAAASAAAAAVAVVAIWNWCRRGREAERFFRRFPDTIVGRGSLPVGELVKISGQVTCGRIPLATSYRDVSRCIFTSSELYEYRGWRGAPANPNHRRFTWGLRHSERNVANFYISDHGSGTRFLVRAGDGAKVTHFVKSKTIDINKGKRELTPNFINWLADNNLSIGDELLRLNEGFIKEGDTASVIGILRRHHACDIIDPPQGKVSTGCQWTRCLFPVLVEGLILLGDENPEDEFVYLA